MVISKTKIFLIFYGKSYRVGGVREVILISGQSQNCLFLKTDSLADTFFWTQNFQKNVKCYEEKVLKNVFQNTFVEKKFKKKFGKFFKGEKFFKIFQNFFSKKYSEKKSFLSIKKIFKNFFHITFYIFLKMFCPLKKMSAKLSCFQKRTFLVFPWNKDYFADFPPRYYHITVFVNFMFPSPSNSNGFTCLEVSTTNYLLFVYLWNCFFFIPPPPWKEKNTKKKGFFFSQRIYCWFWPKLFFL